MVELTKEQTGIKQFLTLLDAIGEVSEGFARETRPTEAIKLLHEALARPRSPEEQAGFERALTQALVINCSCCVADGPGIEEELNSQDRAATTVE